MNDVLFVLFLNLSYPDLINVQLTCKQFNLILNENFWREKYHYDKLPLFNLPNNWLTEYRYMLQIVRLTMDTINDCPKSYYDNSLLYNVKETIGLPDRFSKFIDEYSNHDLITSIKLTWYHHENIYTIICTICSGNRFYKLLNLNKDEIKPFLTRLFYYQFKNDYH